MRVKEMLYYEDENLNLLSGIPDAWRKNGKRIYLKNAKCNFGEFSLEVVFGKQVRVTIESDFETNCVISTFANRKESVRIKKGTNSFVFGG